MLPKPVVKVRMYYVYQVNQQGPRRMDCCRPKGGSTDRRTSLGFHLLRLNKTWDHKIVFTGGEGVKQSVSWMKDILLRKRTD
jgi:hypothetical protein